MDDAALIMSPKTKDITGSKFGKLTCLSFSGYKTIGKKKPIRQASWLCRCECGVEKVFQAAGLIGGGSQSCGCRSRDSARELAKQLGYKNRKNDGSIAARQLYANYKFGAKKRGLCFDISFSDAMVLYQGKCSYCGCEPQKINHIAASDSYFKYNGIDRVDNNIGYTKENCVTACKKCNEAKRAMSLGEFKSWVEQMYLTMFGDKNANL